MSTDTRIESLETQVRTLRRIVFGCLGLAVICGTLAATAVQGVPEVIKAKEFRVVDETGSTRCQILADKIFLCDSDEIPDVGMAKNRGGSCEVFANTITKEGVKEIVRLIAHPLGSRIECIDKTTKDPLGMGNRSTSMSLAGGFGGGFSVRLGGQRIAISESSVTGYYSPDGTYPIDLDERMFDLTMGIESYILPHLSLQRAGGSEGYALSLGVGGPNGDMSPIWNSSTPYSAMTDEEIERVNKAVERDEQLRDGKPTKSP